jgi:hypothetical protein
MKTYEFSIIASGLDPKADDFDDRFYDAGCDDATVSFQKGHIILDFAREAESLVEALSSAIADMTKAGAKVDRVEPDPLVSLSEIAFRTDLSRQAITNYAKGSRGKNFPAPVARVTSDSPLWDWSEVSCWFAANNKLSAESAINAGIVKEANDAIGSGSQNLRDRLAQRAERVERQLEAA